MVCDAYTNGSAISVKSAWKTGTKRKITYDPCVIELAKEDNFYLDLNRNKSKTIGHGQLMRRYSPNVDIDEDNLLQPLMPMERWVVLSLWAVRGQAQTCSVVFSS